MRALRQYEVEKAKIQLLNGLAETPDDSVYPLTCRGSYASNNGYNGMPVIVTCQNKSAKPFSLVRTPLHSGSTDDLDQLCKKRDS